MDGTSNYCSGVSADDSRMVAQLLGSTARVIVCDTADGKQVTNFTIPKEISEIFPNQTITWTQLSHSGRYLLVYDRVYDLDAKTPKLIWQAHEHSTVNYKSALLGDERHVVMRVSDRYEVWDWRKNEKRMTIFLLPQKQWMLFNHETRCWNGSNFAFRHVEFLFRDADGNEEWVVPFVYESRTGWENAPKKAGLSDLVTN